MNHCGTYRVRGTETTKGHGKLDGCFMAKEEETAIYNTVQKNHNNVNQLNIQFYINLGKTVAAGLGLT